jgi:hypothetical protein
VPTPPIATCVRAAFAVLTLSACSPAPAVKQAPAEHSEHIDPPGAATTHADGPADFETADGNIGCNYIPTGGNGVYHSPDGGAELICDRIEPRYLRFSLSARGAATLEEHVRDTGCCGGPILAARTHWSGGVFACDVGDGAVQCENADGGRFTLSRMAASVR